MMNPSTLTKWEFTFFSHCSENWQQSETQLVRLVVFEKTQKGEIRNCLKITLVWFPPLHLTHKAPFDSVHSSDQRTVHP